MINIHTFETVRKQFGHFASWALWADAGKNPKDNIADLSVLAPQANPDLLHILHSDAILIGLNISRRIELSLGNFHDPRPMATDFKIRFALRGTPYWGAYMTDIIKDFEEKASGTMMRFLRSNRDFEEDNIRHFRKELEVLDCTDPLLITFGRDAEAVTKRNLGNEYRIVRIPHYANYISKEEYRKQVHEILP